MRLSEVIEQLQTIQKELNGDPVIAARIRVNDRSLGYYPHTTTRMTDMILGDGED